MSDLELYRYTVTLLALMSLAVNLSLVVGVIHHRKQRIASLIWAVYAAAAAGTNAVSAYFRLYDESSDLPLNVGDFTALVPTLGFLTAGILGWRYLGRTIGRASVDI